MIEDIRIHVKKHKVVYSVGSVVVIAGVAYYLGVRAGSSHVLSPSITFGINTKLDQKVITLVDRQGPPSWVIYCIETGEEFNSQHLAALTHKIRLSDLRAHLNGLLENVNGRHYVRKGLAAA